MNDLEKSAPSNGVKELTPNQREEAILKFWEEHKIFEKSLAQRAGAKPFVFFEGPPTANARPAIHHFIGRAYKDLFCRYQTMRGHWVGRKSGWDTQGLPVELEVEKALGLKSKKDIEQYGIAEFNAKAKASVWQYQEEWERFTKRIGFWLDLEHPYVTYDAKYIESLWWIVKQASERGLLYKDYKVVPYCTRCGTPLSSHEVAQGYESVTDNSVTLKFEILSPLPFETKDYKLKTKNYLLAWTTTPWTLPGNVGLAVGEEIAYVGFRLKGLGASDEIYIAAKDRLPTLAEDYEIVQEFTGKDLVGLKYQPLFAIKELQTEAAYQVYPADFVSTADGTGVVHTAVMYGEEDYQLGLKVGLPRQHTVDPTGRFTAIVPAGLAGQPVKTKETEALVIDYLKANDLLFKAEPYEHDYPFCWRCHTPLLYYAMDSWFFAMSKLKDKLIANNEKVNWYPEHIKEGRFGEWLRGGKDWAISRERYWGTPLPVWQCGDCQKIKVIGSYAELEENRAIPANIYYLMRHGQSEKNEQRVINSDLAQDHYPLVAAGREQAQAEAARLKDSGITQIYCSPFLRCRETAEIMAATLRVPVVVDERLGETKHDSAQEGQSIERVNPTPEEVKDIGLNYRFGTGESWLEIRQRMYQWLKMVEEKHRGEKVLVVSHGDPLVLLMQILNQWDDASVVRLLTTFERQSPGSERVSSDGLIYPPKARAVTGQLKNYPRDATGQLDPHRPFVDAVTIKCQCGGKMQRIKEVMDGWFDSGAMPYAQWHYPFENKEKVDGSAAGLRGGSERSERRKGWNPSELAYPADFIAEGIDQTRGWFFTLLAVATILDREPPYKNVLCYGHVLDAKGKKMSKSKGNVINPWEMIEKYGVDAVRWYFYSTSAPGDSKLFVERDVDQKLKGFIGNLRNIVRFYQLYLPSESKPPELNSQPSNLLDEWILSRLNQLIDSMTKQMEQYDPTGAARALEQFVLEDLSKWWLRRSRANFQRPESAAALQQSLGFLCYLLLTVAKLLAPFTPYLAEEVHQIVGEPQNLSVHLADWPKTIGPVDDKLIVEMAEVRNFVSAGLASRKETNLKVRQPLRAASLKRVEPFSSELEELIKDELNIKAVNYDTKQAGDIVLDKELTSELKQEGLVRELLRQIQDLRKAAGYEFNQSVNGRWQTTDGELAETIKQWLETIKAGGLLENFTPAENLTDGVEFLLDENPVKSPDGDHGAGGKIKIHLQQK